MDKQKLAVTTAIGNRIRAMRQENNVSQEELAYRASLNVAYLGQIERGQKCPTVDTLFKISKALNTTLSELVYIGESSSIEDQSSQIKDLLMQIPEKKREIFLQAIKSIVELI